MSYINPRLAFLRTAIPPHILQQDEVAREMRGIFSSRVRDFDRFQPIFENAAIDKRRSCVPLDWYRVPHSFPERNAIYIESALSLLEDVARQILDAANLAADQIDGLVVVSSTGIATPSLDAHLVNRLGLRPNVVRTPLFGLGCAAGVTGLARTAQLAGARPGSKYLFLVVELCALTFQIEDASIGNIISSALFADGAAGALVGTEIEGPAILGWGEHTWPDTLGVMGWDLRDNGLGVILSADIPTIVRTKLQQVLDTYLADEGLELSDIKTFVSHPGGVKVLDALEEICGMEPGGMTIARDVLRNYGNMSSPTVLFILRDALAAGPAAGKLLLSAMGPGFTATFSHLDVPENFVAS